MGLPAGTQVGGLDRLYRLSRIQHFDTGARPCDGRAAAKARRAAARKAAARPKARAKPRSQPKPRPKPRQ
ncbi:hypothetical protein ACWIID_47040, partial [Streptomyces phaeochromogenes]